MTTYESGRAYASAFLCATAAALAADAALQLALEAVRVAPGGGAPWWITAHVVERGRWVVFAALVAWLASRPGMASHVPALPLTTAAGTAWRQVAIAVVAVPVLWIAATWTVTAVRFTLQGTWDTAGRVFLSADYYRGLLLDLAPWLMAGAVVGAVSRHVD